MKRFLKNMNRPVFYNDKYNLEDRDDNSQDRIVDLDMEFDDLKDDLYNNKKYYQNPDDDFGSFSGKNDS